MPTKVTATKQTPTSGLLTTEFYVTVAVIICTLILGLADKIDGGAALAAITGAAAAYSVSRGIAKS